MKIPVHKILPDGLPDPTSPQEIELTDLQTWELIGTLLQHLDDTHKGANVLEFRKSVYNSLMPTLLQSVNGLPLKDAIEKLNNNLKTSRLLVEHAREIEGLAHQVLSERVRLTLKEQKYGELRDIQNYVPLPPSVFDSEDDRRKSSPSINHIRSDSEQIRAHKPSQSNEEKQVERIAKLMFKGDLEKAKQWIKENG